MEEFKDRSIFLHGGEILCLPKKDIIALLSKTYELQGRSSIQTNGILIDDELIEAFKKYKTKVSISWDGPGELNAYRPGSSKVGTIIRRLVKKGISVSILTVITKANAETPKLLNKLKKHILYFHQLGIKWKLSPCTHAPDFELSMERLKEVYLDLAKFCLYNNLRYIPFNSIVKGLQGKNNRLCFFLPCDFFCTREALTVLGDGSLSNCMAINSEDVLLRDFTEYGTREEILQKISQEHGGCKDCKYWTTCYGGCPSDAIDNDWRNRTYFCPLWKVLFEFYEKILGYCDIPVVSQKPVCQEKSVQEPDEWHGDAEHEDSGHGDAPHGDSG